MCERKIFFKLRFIVGKDKYLNVNGNNFIFVMFESKVRDEEISLWWKESKFVLAFCLKCIVFVKS